MPYATNGDALVVVIGAVAAFNVNATAGESRHFDSAIMARSSVDWPSDRAATYRLKSVPFGFAETVRFNIPPNVFAYVTLNISVLG
jgi:hypothetical protein